jgi:glycosyltransferase involved in cell wall biosynthesis
LKPYLSVIIPVYNAEEYLDECINSVYIQNVPEIEIICVNDGSTDKSFECLNKIKLKHPDLIIINQSNAGLAAARNSGYKLATGKFIYFFDNDDYLYPNVFSKMLDFANSKDLDISFFNVLKDGKEPYFIIKNELKEVMTGIEIFKINYELNGFFPPSAVWTCLFRKDFLDNNNLVFLEGREHEDEEFTPRAYFLANRVALLNIPIQFHRITRKGSITESTLLNFKERHLKHVIETCSDLYYYFNKMKCEENLFYLKIFHNYLAMAKIIIDKKPERKNNLFTKNDFNTMRLCAISWDWYVYYFLFRYSSTVFKWYTSEKASPFLKMLVTKLFKLIYS